MKTFIVQQFLLAVSLPAAKVIWPTLDTPLTRMNVEKYT